MTPADTIVKAQARLRAIGRNARTQLTDEQRRDASKIIAGRVLESALFQNAVSIACYVPLPDEVSTWPIIERAWRMKKRIFAPVTEKNLSMRFREFTNRRDLETRKWGLQEPANGQIAEAESLELVIAPLVAFDAQRNRIGMGGGYYDRAFSFLGNPDDSPDIHLIGIAFDCQQVEKITPNPWDIRLFRVFTESRSI